MEDNKKDEETNQEEPELPKQFSDNLEKEKKRYKVMAEVEKQLRSDPKYREFLKDYTDTGWDNFVRYYALIKACASENKELYIKRHEQKELEYYNNAEESLWEIQQKKLFNYQCLWRAEKVKTEYVEVETDFDYWSRNISSCPFIEPITDEEFELYKNFLETSEVDDFINPFAFIEWQDYHTYKSEAIGEEEVISYPEWYSYYDMRMGTGALMLLPDIRGEKEKYYLDIYHENNSKSNPEVSRFRFDDRKYFESTDYEIINGFIKKFEDPSTQKYMYAYENVNNRGDGIEFEIFIHELCEIQEVMPIEAHYDWRIAITRAYNNYVRRKVIEQLDVVYSEYKNRINMGICFPAPEIDLDRDTRKNIIIEARILNGEPPDLNF